MSAVDLYKVLGISSSKEGVHKAVKKAAIKNIVSDSFANVTYDLAGSKTHGLIAHTDGIGSGILNHVMLSKLKKEPSYFSLAPSYAIIMNTDDSGCAAPIYKAIMIDSIARNSFMISDEELEATIFGFQQYFNNLKKWGIDIFFAGGEVADLPDQTDTMILDASMFARVELKKVLSGKNIQPGDVIIALQSAGKRARYEKYDVNEWGSNGATLMRRSILSDSYNRLFPYTLYTEFIDQIKDESSGTPEEINQKVTEAMQMIQKYSGDDYFFGKLLKQKKGYRGEYEFDDKISGSKKTVGEELTFPPRTYLPVTNHIIEKYYNKGLKFIAQLSGGAQTKEINFGRGLNYIKDEFFDPAPIFTEVQKFSGQPWRYMYRTFNMGSRLSIITKENIADDIIKDCEKDFGIKAIVSGRVEKRKAGMPKNEKGNCVTLETPFGTFKHPEEKT